MRRNTFRGAIYAETFAAWMVLFIGMNLLTQLFDESGLSRLLSISMFFGSLVVMGWPLIRGIKLSEMLDDVGLRFRNPLKEALVGFAAYLAAMPLLAIGFAASVILMLIGSMFVTADELAPTSGPSHPIQQEAADASGISQLLVIAFLAVVAAPIVEEIVFRGVLYRHLRDATWRWPNAASMLFAALVNSVLFASIHPQGIFGIPILTTLAISFSLAREWRDSLVAPMVMHAVNNGLVVILLAFMIGL